MLRVFRLILAAVFFSVTTFLFLDFAELLPVEYSLVAKLQFIPAFMSHSLAVVLGIILVTLVFGRFYCSTVCPLGVGQDVTTWLGGWFLRKRKFHYSKPKTWLRLLSLLVFLVSLHGTGLYATLVEPYSLYGRIMYNIFRPGYILYNNIFVWIQDLYGGNTLYFVDCVRVLPVVLTTVAFFVLIAVLAFMFGRTWCNTICPVGTFLGLIARFSFWKIRIDKSKCISCGLCAMKCKAACIDSKEKSVDHSRCVDCFNCLSACKKDAIHYSLFGIKSPDVMPQSQENESVTPPETKESNTEVDTSKREFLSGLATATLALSTGKLLADDGQAKQDPDAKKSAASDSATNGDSGQVAELASAKDDETLIRRTIAIAPPGAKSIAHLNHHCTACQLCMAKCPSFVLKPAFLEYGVSGMFQPIMSFERGFCNFDCTVCADVCPNQAIEPLSMKEKHQIQMGRVHFNIDRCIVYTEETSCGACSEHCPTQAVHMIPYKGNLTIPKIDPELCVGCGGCEHICPVRPDRAIFVQGNEVHQKAKPIVEAEKKEVDLDNFGF